MTANVRLEFTTPITAINGAGKRNEAARYWAVTPLRDELLKIYGIVGCRIEQDHITATYRTRVTDEATVIEAVQTAVRAIADIGNLFPLRGEETPEALLSEPSEPAHTWQAAMVSFISDIHFGVHTSTEVMEELMNRLTKIDGIHDPHVDTRYLFVKFDARETAPDSVRTHLEEAVNTLMAEWESKGYFPFCATESKPSAIIQVYRTRIPII